MNDNDISCLPKMLSGWVLPEDYAVRLLRAAGCTDEQPLLGWRPGEGPRCRMCGTVAVIPTARHWEVLRRWSDFG